MPQGFLNCVKKGGRVVTKKIDDKRYMHICYLDGKSYAGEVLYKKSSKEKKADSDKSKKK